MITYIFKAILFSAILLAVYRLFLEKEKIYQFNRFYLLLSITLPFIIPLITIPPISFMPQITRQVIDLNTKVCGIFIFAEISSS